MVNGAKLGFSGQPTTSKQIFNDNIFSKQQLNGSGLQFGRILWFDIWLKLMKGFNETFDVKHRVWSA
jgi:hypothetical protein